MADIGTKSLSVWDRGARIPRAPFEIGLAFTGPFVTFDFAKFATSYPDWKGPISWATPASLILFSISILVLSLSAFCSRKSIYGRTSLEKRAQRAQELEDLVAERFKEIMDGMLLAFGRKLKLAEDAQARISLYVQLGSNNDPLMSLGRYSTNPMHETTGRKFIPITEGCVGRAWENGWAIETDLGRGGAYLKKCEELGISQEVSKAMKMKPRFISAIRIGDRHTKAIAVLVFESKKQNFFEEACIRDEMNQFSVFFEHAIPKITPHLPDLNLAAKEGL